MFSLLKYKTESTQVFCESTHGHVVIDANGEIIAANDVFLDIVFTITGSCRRSAGVVGKNLKSIVSKEYWNTPVGASMLRKKQVNEQFLIGHQVYQVIVRKIEQGNEIYHEAFYIPIRLTQETADDSFFQNLAYKVATQKGFHNSEWIKELSVTHAKQLISCLYHNTHRINPSEYCPFGDKCGFNEAHGWEDLDRHLYKRTKVAISGNVYVIALRDRSVPSYLSQKKIACKALDLSLTGVKLQLSAGLPLESILKLVFQEFTCEGSIRWIEKKGEKWQMGVKFMLLNSDQRKSIIKTIVENQPVLSQTVFFD